MGWSLGYDSNWKRDIGYGVPAVCDQPGCEAEIHRGISYVCGGEPYGGDHGCGLYFCSHHLYLTDKKPQRCERCAMGEDEPFAAKPDAREWVEHKLNDESWGQWRAENVGEVEAMRRAPSLPSQHEIKGG